LALKGGTAINLFARNMPRHIDLTYLPLKDRVRSILVDGRFQCILNWLNVRYTVL